MKSELKPRGICFEKEKEGWSAFLVIDSLYDGIGIGGIRIVPDLTLKEIEVSAREMTNKLLFTGFRWRIGAKGGLRIPADCEPEKRKRILYRYGQIIGRFIREDAYRPGLDLGCGVEELNIIKKGAGLSDPLNKPVLAAYAPYFTALTVFSSALAYATHHSLNLSDLKIAIEGFGRVGSHVAELFHQAGSKLIAVSTVEKAVLNWKGLNVPRLLELREQYSDHLLDQYLEADVIPKADLLTLKTDILLPGARTWTINKDNAADLETDAVIAIANVPFSPEGEEILRKKGIFYLPSYVSNCGGIYGIRLMGRGYKKDQAEKITSRKHNQWLTQLLEVSRKRNILPSQIAEEWIQQRAQKRKRFLANTLSRLRRRKIFLAVSKNTLVRRMVILARRMGRRILARETL